MIGAGILFYSKDQVLGGIRTDDRIGGFGSIRRGKESLKLHALKRAIYYILGHNFDYRVEDEVKRLMCIARALPWNEYVDCDGYRTYFMSFADLKVILLACDFSHPLYFRAPTTVNQLVEKRANVVEGAKFKRLCVVKVRELDNLPCDLWFRVDVHSYQKRLVANISHP